MSTNLYTRAQRLHRLAHELPDLQAVETIRAMLRVVRDEGIARGIEQFATVAAIDAARALAHTKATTQTKGESHG